MKTPFVNILWRHCSDCGCITRSVDRSICSSCSNVRDTELKLPSIEEFSSDVTDAYDEFLPEMEQDIKKKGVVFE